MTVSYQLSAVSYQQDQRDGAASEKQVPRLRKIVRKANDLSTLGMTGFILLPG
jgi:hypothetical protein